MSPLSLEDKSKNFCKDCWINDLMTRIIWFFLGFFFFLKSIYHALIREMLFISSFTLGCFLPTYNWRTTGLFRVDPCLTATLLGKALRATNNHKDETLVKLLAITIRSLYHVIIFNNGHLHWMLYSQMSLHLNSSELLGYIQASSNHCKE